MPLIHWTDELNINVRELDDQHKKLACIANEFYEYLSADPNNKTLYKILDDLIADTSSHFLREEAIMELYKYPGYDEHKEYHNILSKEVTNMFKGFCADDKKKTVKIAFFLKDWLMEHISGEDKELGKFLNSKGID